MMQIAPSMKMILNLSKQDRLGARGNLRVAFTYRSSFSKNRFVELNQFYIAVMHCGVWLLIFL